jgi:hypothetical protein
MTCGRNEKVVRAAASSPRAVTEFINKEVE